jgi:hypothetical protein
MNAAHLWRGKRLPLAILVTASALGLAIGVRSTASAAPNALDPCPKLSEAPNLPQRPGGGLLRGDVDGDGVRDRVSIRYAAKALASCGFLLVVETRSKTFAARVPEEYKPPEDLPVSQWPFAEPFVALIVRLNAYRSQVVVARSHGAAVVNVSLHGIVAGRLAQLRFSPKLYADQLSLFGTVGTGDTNARCRWNGPLIILRRSPTSATGQRWRFDRIEYRLAGGRFTITRTRSTVVSEAQTAKVSRRWGFDVKPFTGCAIARGRRL